MSHFSLYNHSRSFSTGRERSYDPPYEFNRIHERSPERAPPPDNYSYSDARYQNPSPTPTHRDIPQPSLNNTRPGSYRTQYDDRGQWVPRYSPEPPSAPPPFEGWTRDQHTPYYSRPRQPFSIRPPTRGNTSITSPQPSPTHSRIPFNERGRNDSIQSGNSDGGRPPYRTSTDTYRGSHRSRSSSRSSEFNRSRQLPTYRPKSPTPLDNHTESLASTPHGDHLMISRDQSPVPSRFNSLGEPTYKMDRRPSPSPVPSSPISHNHSQIYDQPGKRFC